MSPAAAASWSGWAAARPRRGAGARAAALASRARSSATRTDQPPGDRRAGQAPALAVVLGQQQRAAVALGQRAVLEQLEHLVGQVEQPQEVGDRDAAAADAAADLLAREPELLDERRARRAPPRSG